MKYLFGILVLLICEVVLAQVVPAPAAVAVVAAPVQMGVLLFLKNNYGIIAAALVAVLDLMFALNPNANAPDGMLHAIYMFLKNLIQKNPPANPPAA